MSAMSDASPARVVLLVGAGAREHALALALLRSPQVAHVLVAPGNAGLEHEALRDPRIVRVVDIEDDPDAPMSAAARLLSEPADLLAVALRYGVDLTIIGPEGPLAAGVVDQFHAVGRRVFGPTRAAAEIETSKAFSKAFMQRHQIPTARGEAFTRYEDARGALPSFALPVVLKASGLAAGKGVFICDTRAIAEDVLWRMMEGAELGAAGREVVIEEHLAGREVSLMAFSDGTTFRTLPAARDHKRLGDGDVGPITGGMGAFAPVPDVGPELIAEIERSILAPAIAGLASEGRPFVGVLFAGCMLTADGPRCLEFNARFGDPEAQAILPLITSDLVTVIDGCIDGRLDEVELTLDAGATVAVVLAAPGYPGNVQPGSAIKGLAEARAHAAIFAAGVDRLSSGYAAVGGRVLTVVGTGPDLSSARVDAYRAIAAITIEGMQYRRDIGLSVGSPSHLTLERNPHLAAPQHATYASAGVDIEAANSAVRGMKRAVESTFTPFVLSKLGSYGGLFDAKAFAGLAHPVLVASTDGVGTKTMVARAMNRWDTIGRDLVAHSVNDILVMGARPLFFLDYVASGKLDPAVIVAVVTGLAAACKDLGVALLGGETAELPGVYQPNEIDLAGTIVGVVDKADIIDGTRIEVGDLVFGLPSSGLHTNGYSLARKVFEGLDLAATPDGFEVSLGAALLATHRPYLSEITSLWDAGLRPTGLVHVTGGGFVDNPPRILDASLAWSLDLHAWQWPPLFRLIQARGSIPDLEMAKVMNLGIGMLVVLRPADVAAACALLPELVPIGAIIPRPRDAAQVVFIGAA